MIADDNAITPTVFRELSDYALDGIVMTDMTLKILYANQAAHTMFGYAEGELIGQNATMLWPEEDLPMLQALMPQIMSGGWSGEARNKRKDGSLITVSSVAFAVGGGDGRTPTALAVMVRDMNERKQAEEALDQQNRILQTLLENMPFATFMVEAPSGKPVLANQKATEFLGRGIMPDATEDTLAEVYQAYRYGTDEIYPTPEMPVVRGMFGETSHVEDMEVRRPDGTRTLLEVYGTPVYDKAHKVCWSLVNFVDITERKQAEESLRLRDQAVQQQNHALLTLAGNSAMYGGDLNTALRLIAETAAQALNTRRMSIWFYTEEPAGIRCANLYELDDNRHSAGLVLPAKDYPVYFKALKQGQAILAHDALTDPRTSEFAESYLKPLGISSMLDVPIQVAGQIIGVVCHEHIGPARQWTAEEQSFVTAIAGYISTVLETYEHKRVEAEQERLQQEIIEAQRRTLQELSTPIIPVMERIIVMPLVGSIDSLRARDITRSLLAGIREHRAKIVILDITGVPLVDSGVASHLNKTIQAARLKGARTIITGVSDAVAETVVDLGIDWGNVETLADLQTGLTVALGSLGIELVKRKM